MTLPAPQIDHRRQTYRRVAQLGLLGLVLLAAASWMLGPAATPPPTEAGLSPLSWIATSTLHVLLEVSLGLTITLVLGVALGCMLQTRERSSSPLSGRWSIIGHSIPAFLIVALLRTRHGETLPFDLAIVVGVVNGLEAARWIRAEWIQFEMGSVAQAVRAVGFDAGHVLRLFGPTLARTLPLVAARTCSGIVGLQALLAFFHLNFGDLSTWGALLGETAARHEPLTAPLVFCLAAATGLPLAVQVVVEHLTVRERRPS
jgi:hypothetical protein